MLKDAKGLSFHIQMFDLPADIHADQQGENVTFTSRWSRDEPFVNGARLPILYDPQHPHNAEVNQFRPMWEGLIFISIGMIVLTAASLILRKVEAYLQQTSGRKSG